MTTFHLCVILCLERKALAPSLMKYFIHVDTPQTTKIEMTAPSADKSKDNAPERKPASSVRSLYITKCIIITIGCSCSLAVFHHFWSSDIYLDAGHHYPDCHTIESYSNFTNYYHS